MEIALTGLSVDPSQAVAVNSNYYVNKKFGFILTKPDNWDFVSIKDFGKLKADQLLAEDFEPNKDEIWQELGDPTLLIAKYGADKPEYKGKFSPAISVFINHKDDIKEIYNDEDINGDFEEIVGMVAYGSSRLFKNYQTIQEMRPFKLSRCNGFHSLWTWTFDSIQHKKSWNCQTWSIIVEKGNFISAFNMIDSEDAGEVEKQIFKTFVESIKII